jgi:cellulose synthase/poly-beta-1,6-N-acetylglucosamine synthase-like glycosyltransferase
MSEAPPAVAVICCFLDGREFLAEAIDSVIAQGFADWTLTLVDDGSTDGASELARDYARRDPRIRYLEHAGHANLGLSASRNAGLAASTGELVAFIDADDVWAPDKLAEQVAILAADPGLAMVCGATRYWRAWAGGEDAVVLSGHRQNVRIEPPEALLEVYPLGGAPAPPPSGLLLRRSAIERVGGFEAQFRGPLALYEDQAFLAKLYAGAPVWFADREWLWYRQRADSIMATVRGQGRYHEVRRAFLKWYLGYLRRAEIDDPRIRAAVLRARRPYRIRGLGRLRGWIRQIGGKGQVSPRVR